MAEASKKELALFPNQFSFFQNLMTGMIKTHVGPLKVNPGQQDRAVLYNEKSGTFYTVNDIEEAIQTCVFVPEGFYLQLLNPSFYKQKGQKEGEYIEELVFPTSGKEQDSAELRMGRKINIQGPVSFPLWPGQAAKLIRGHQPRSNQYLLIRVYNAEEATKHWKEAKIQAATTPAAQQTIEVGAGAPTVGQQIEDANKAKSLPATAPTNLKEGDLFIIKGTEVSFYIPPTGIQVLSEGTYVDEKGKTRDLYVREALTLERMEYCILVDEDGNKRIERGPQVVFPNPTERFIEVEGKEGKNKGQIMKKFPAIELTRLQGIHLMVTADYTDEIGKKFKAGEEIFLKGADGNQIYFPRVEHRFITYDGQQKHFATAIPAGEGRYVMERMSSKIKTVRGYAMYLPDPREEVFVRRALTEKQCKLWYPGNQEVADYNRKLREMATKSPTTRAGAVSEGEYERTRGMPVAASATAMKSISTRSMVSAESFMEKSGSNKQGFETGAEESTRSSTYTQPRELTLGNRFGVPIIRPFTGFAVCVVTAGTNKRRIEVGPTTILLDYDEDLEMLSLSTGKPKNTDVPYDTVYLRTKSNLVSDVIIVETRDHVSVQLKYGLNVDFEDSHKEKWFSVQNYVKLLTDHVRSILKAQIKKLSIAEFYVTSTDLIRDFLLGKTGEGGKRSMPIFFTENGMHVTDVDVLETTILEPVIKKLMEESAIQTVKQNIELATEEQKFKVLAAKEEIARKTAEEQAQTVIAKNDTEIEKGKSIAKVEQEKTANEKAITSARFEVIKLQQDTENFTSESIWKRKDNEKSLELTWAQKTQDQKIAFIKAESEATIARVHEMNGGFNEVVAMLHDQGTLEKVAQALSVQSLIGGKSVLEVLQQLVGPGLGNILSAALERSGQNGDRNKTPALPQART